MKKPYIGITMGDPSGIGPEIVLKAIQTAEIYHFANPVVIGSAHMLAYQRDLLKIELAIKKIFSPVEGVYTPEVINIIDLNNVDLNLHQFGRVQAASGKAAYDYIVKAVALAKDGQLNAIATAPINKAAIHAAGIDFIGHTEMLAALTGTAEPLTMFQVQDLRVFFLSRHLSLKEAIKLVKRDRIITYLERCNRALRMLGLPGGTIAVAGLNPHCGEGGLLGTEEREEIEPAVKFLQAKGFKVAGPLPADSVFQQALQGRFAAVLSLYHDQGHIATKMVDFDKTVSLTLGLPFLRTSPDHGTAFDLAGKGCAGAGSMIEAIKLAAWYSKNYRR
ncbi:MAG: 4-hydroxythreonine-4-phosphate dehydrogenase PdxA [Firmicutes bacterium]|nr:4-hydroxythreonine-4-phosphate dehydrogenase PdxA [Bacillota bacterium]